MRKLTLDELADIDEAIATLCPAFDDAIIENGAARLPSMVPEAVGCSLREGLILGLQHEAADFRREVAHEIWLALPDRKEIHHYKGFHILCDLLDNVDDNGE